MALEKKPDPPCFERQLKDILKKFPKSKDAVLRTIAGLPEHADEADSIPRMGGHLKKLRCALPEYNISKRRGLRIVFMVNQGIVTAVAVYYKGDGKAEGDILDTIKKNIKEILES